MVKWAIACRDQSSRHSLLWVGLWSRRPINLFGLLRQCNQYVRHPRACSWIQLELHWYARPLQTVDPGYVWSPLGQHMAALQLDPLLDWSRCSPNCLCRMDQLRWNLRWPIQIHELSNCWHWYARFIHISGWRPWIFHFRLCRVSQSFSKIPFWDEWIRASPSSYSLGLPLL